MALPTRPSSSRRLLALASRLGFGTWAVLSTLVVASLGATHWYSLPRPSTHDARLARALDALRRPGDRGRWLVAHFLYADCRCSQRVLAHLLERGPRHDPSETIVLVGGGAGVETARRRGFAVDVVEPSRLAARYHVEAAPVFAVAGPDGTVRYLGGYTERKQAYAILDTRIVRDLRQGRRVEELAVYGCPTSLALQRRFDPFRLKYANAERE